MNFRQPDRFEASNTALDNFADLAARIHTSGDFVDPDFIIEDFPSVVVINSFDELCMVIEQEYYLAKAVIPKLPLINNDPEIQKGTLTLVSRYLSADQSPHIANAKKVKKQAMQLLAMLLR